MLSHPPNNLVVNNLINLEKLTFSKTKRNIFWNWKYHYSLWYGNAKLISELSNNGKVSRSVLIYKTVVSFFRVQKQDFADVLQNRCR